MKVLVTVGSKYGSTREVGAEIVKVLRDKGFETDFEDACDVSTVRYYDAVIIGSAVYGSLWRRDAAGLVRENADLLRARDTWMFSVGMTSVTTPDQPIDEAEGLARLSGAIEHKRFDGRLELDRLNVGERALIKVINPPVGDFRDFDEVRAWAGDIAVRLSADAFA